MTLPAGWEGCQHNFLGLEEPWCHPEHAGVYVLPAPYEHTSSYVPGSDQGPSAIIEASHQVECYDEMLRCEPFRDWGGIATVTPLDLRGRVDREAVEAIEGFVRPHVGAGRFIVTLTGEHTDALGAIRAHAKRYHNLNVVQIDAHGDLRHAYQDNPYSHASVMARVVDDGLPLVQVGIRSICPEEIERITSSDRISTFFAAHALWNLIPSLAAFVLLQLARLLGAVPRSVPRQEEGVAVFIAESVAGVELQRPLLVGERLYVPAVDSPLTLGLFFPYVALLILPFITDLGGLFR